MVFYNSTEERVEVSTTNLEKSVSGLVAASNVSIQVRAFNEQGVSPPSPPVFCSTHDASKIKTTFIFITFESERKYFILFSRYCFIQVTVSEFFVIQFQVLQDG